MARYIWRDGEIIEIPKDYTPPPRKGPYIISDNHEPFRSMVDGLWYDSKSSYRKSLKAKGMVEMGNEMPRQREYEPQNVGQDIKDAIEQVRAGKGAIGTDKDALAASISTGRTKA
jgi:hypothetical protein